MAKLKKIVLEYDGKEIELTEAQAQGLYHELGKLFADKTSYVPIPQPYPIPVYPYYEQPYRIVWTDKTETWTNPIPQTYCKTEIKSQGGNDFVVDSTCKGKE